MPESFPQDLALARRMAARDPKAWEEAAARYTAIVRAVAQRALRGEPPEALDDATEEVFLELLSRESAALLAYRGEAPLGAYLAVVSRRVALRLGEEMKRRRLDPPRLAELARHLAEQRREEHLAPDLDGIRKALEALPARQRYILHALAEGRTPAELGRELGCAPGVVSTLAWRARRKLREIMKSPEMPGRKGPP